MGRVWSMGEILVEIMRPKPDMPFHVTGEFLGPFPSGAPAIFIDTVARLGHSAGIIGGVGKDGFGKIVLDRLKRDGVDCSYIFKVEGKSTAVAFVSYTREGSRDFIYHVDNTPAVMVHDLDEIDIEADFFHVMGCSLMFNESFGKNIMELAERLWEKGTKISFDPNIRKELLGRQNVRDSIEPIMRKCSIFLPGVDELKLISGRNDADEAVDELFHDYKELEIVVLKRGKKGATVYTRSEKRDIPAVEVEEVDPTGAGDYFDAGFISALLDGKDPITAGKIATIAGALNVVAFGPMEGEINPEKIEKMMSQFE